MVKFLFSVHTITEAKQSNWGRSQGGGSSSQVIWPCAPLYSVATGGIVEREWFGELEN